MFSPRVQVEVGRDMVIGVESLFGYGFPFVLFEGQPPFRLLSRYIAIAKEMAERRTCEIIGFPTFLLRIVSLPTIEWHVESGDDIMVFFVEVVLPG